MDALDLQWRVAPGSLGFSSWQWRSSWNISKGLGLEHRLEHRRWIECATTLPWSFLAGLLLSSSTVILWSSNTTAFVDPAVGLAWCSAWQVKAVKFPWTDAWQNDVTGCFQLNIQLKVNGRLLQKLQSLTGEVKLHFKKLCWHNVGYETIGSGSSYRLSSSLLNSSVLPAPTCFQTSLQPCRKSFHAITIMSMSWRLAAACILQICQYLECLLDISQNSCHRIIHLFFFFLFPE